MKNKNFTYVLAIILIVIASLSRLIPHQENFSPILGIALLGTAYLPNKWLKYFVPIAVMFISDLFLGLHSTMLFTYGSLALIVWVSSLMLKKVNFRTILNSSLLASIIFFLVTNFGFWLMSGLYTLDISGLARCFELAIPFYRNTLTSCLISTAVLFGIYQGSLALVQKFVLSK
jgi:hypothetical protein